MVRRIALIALLTAILGIAAVPAVSYSAGAGKPRDHPCTMAKFHRLHKCSKATIVVHIPNGGGEAPAPGERRPTENTAQPLKISRLTASGKIISSFKTHARTVHVVPGRYEVAVLDGTGPPLAEKTVTVSAGQVLKLTLRYPMP